jgi:hypothetical protein
MDKSHDHTHTYVSHQTCAAQLRELSRAPPMQLPWLTGGAVEHTAFMLMAATVKSAHAADQKCADALVLSSEVLDNLSSLMLINTGAGRAPRAHHTDKFESATT